MTCCLFVPSQNVSLETTPPAPPTEEEGEEEIEELVLTRVDDEIEEVDGVEGDGVQGASVQGDGVKGDGVQGDDVEDGKDEVSSVAKDAEVTLRAPPTSQLLPSHSHRSQYLQRLSSSG